MATKRRREMIIAALAGLAVLISVNGGTAIVASGGEGEWPQWHGRNRDNISAEKGLLQEWPKEGPALAWKAQGLGSGYSSMSIAGGRIYTMGDAGGASHAIALELAGGRKLWSAKVGAAGGGGGVPGTRCTPTVDEELVFALNQFGDLVCVRARDGTEVWRKSMTKDFGGAVGGWGYSESPLVDGEKVVCTPGGRGGSIIALEKKSGAQVWRSKGLGDAASYASLIIAEIGGVRQYIVLTDAHVAGIAAADGAVLWQADRRGQTAVCTTPVCKGNLVFVTSSYGVGCNCFRIAASGGRFNAEQVYANKEMENHHGGVILLGDHVYGCSENGGLRCMELATGNVTWKTPGNGGGGSLTYADGRLIHRDELGGVELVVASPDGYKQVGRFNQPDRSEQSTWAHPVVAGGKLYLRDQDVLLCYDVKAK
jgi:outer membrane protein assembly factor BamB